jgi:ribosome recycling factor
MIDGIIKEVKPKMKSAIEKLSSDLTRIRTGRANPGILDGIMVSYYGTNTAIRELASITVPESNQILIKPWDRGALNGIEAAIRTSDIGINPINDGQQVRLVLPPMTEERRKDIATQVKKSGEETKVAFRNIRKEAWDKVQSAEKSNLATEDDRYWAEEELNKIIDEMNKEVDKVVQEKETEIMKI